MKIPFSTCSLRTTLITFGLIGSGLLVVAGSASGQTATADGTALPAPRNSVSTGIVSSSDPAASVEGVVVSATPAPTPHDDWKAKLDHIMSEVSGTQITVTKKATAIKLEKQPPIEQNDLQTEFLKAPGFLITEQHTPGQFNFSYRGLGNPQESEYVTVLMDRVPLMSDWIGFPTLYFLPLPQTISEIQFIRGGSSLLYGPEPAPAINFVTKRPIPGQPWTAYLEEVGGSSGYYSTYGSVQEASGRVELRLDGGFVTTEGQRDNSDYDLWQADGYLGYHITETNLIGVDVHASRFDGNDPGRLTYKQFIQDQDQSTTPYNHNWVDRYNVVLHDEWKFGDGWLMQAQGWYTHQQIDQRTAANINPITGAFPTSTVFGYEEFNNGGGDVRFRKNWGEDTMFKGSALTFGGTVYHGDAPFQRFTLQNTPLAFPAASGGGTTQPNYNPDFLYAPRGAQVETILIRGGQTLRFPTLDQDRESDYQAFFIENIFRLGKFHIVPSFRLDHESVEVDSHAAPWTSPPLPPGSPLIGASSVDADKLIPLWGIGLGNDFGNHNETYFSASTGWRPTRYFDIASTNRTIVPGQDPDPFHSLDFELGVHGTPYRGFWYDVGAFWMEFDNRTESRNISNTEVDIANTGSSRHRGFEGELSYDFLAPFQHPPEPASAPVMDPKDAKDHKETVVAGATEPFRPWQLIAFSNAQYLDARFTDSDLTITPTSTQTLVGNRPAFAPRFLTKGGLSLHRDKCFDLSLSAVYVSQQYWNDANIPNTPFPAIRAVHPTPSKLAPYKVFNLSGEWYVTNNVRIFFGVSNLLDEKYYSRVFFNGSIEPAPHRSGFGGLSVEF